MTKEQELKLWEQSKVRYDRIRFIIENLFDGICDEGCEELKIPECGFCQASYDDGFDCRDCPWGKKFDGCQDDNSEWGKMYDLVKRTLLQVEKTLEGVSSEISRLSESD